ncbi:hypothetical protein [Nocardia crassostreae]|uniref:hypothetical protein n=1 Tax=Nocardia crassostreae TaxID=53428 RepID=UPI0008366B51|nr:hypothetical protein [Nocardia crassostreae]
MDAHRGLLAIVLFAGVVIAAPPVHAAPPPTLRLGFHNGYCTTTELDAPADTPFAIEIDTGFQFTDQSEFRIPALKIRVILPSSYFNPRARVDVPAQPPGPIPFELMTPKQSGSAGDGCWGVIHVR